jgi:hypothetical protein
VLERNFAQTLPFVEETVGRWSAQMMQGGSKAK